MWIPVSRAVISHNYKRGGKGGEGELTFFQVGSFLLLAAPGDKKGSSFSSCGAIVEEEERQ